jgi:hypothetical protein
LPRTNADVVEMGKPPARFKGVRRCGSLFVRANGWQELPQNCAAFAGVSRRNTAENLLARHAPKLHCANTKHSHSLAERSQCVAHQVGAKSEMRREFRSYIIGLDKLGSATARQTVTFHWEWAPELPMKWVWIGVSRTLAAFSVLSILFGETWVRGWLAWGLKHWGDAVHALGLRLSLVLFRPLLAEL